MLWMRMTGDTGMDLPRFLALVRARRWLIAAIVGVAFLLALAASSLQGSRYEARAKLLFGHTSSADAIVAGGVTDTGEVPERTAATNVALASLEGVAVRVKQQLGASSSAEKLKDAVSVHAEGESDLGTVAASWDTPEGAAAVANAFADQIVTVRREAAQADIQRAIDALNATLTEQSPPPEPGAAPAPETAATRTLRARISQLQTLKALETGGVRVVEEARPPEGRSSPRPLRNAVIAAVVALALALFLVAALARFDERIGDEDELAALMGAPVLARIPRIRSRRLLSGSTAHEEAAFLEAFEFLRLNLQFTGPDRGSLVLAVTSACQGDGKTTVVSWLASSLGLGGAEVVAVDLDVHKPELYSHLNAFDERRNGASPVERREDKGEPVGAVRAGAARRVYSTEDITVGLRQLVRSGGNARRAAELLRAGGRDISESTLRRWKLHHAALYAELGATRSVPAGVVFADEAPTPDDLTVPTLHPHVRLLAAGYRPALPFRREWLQRLFARLRENADYVLIDTVPVSTVADASAVAAAADGVLLVVDVERTHRRDLLAAKKQLDTARADLRGIVLTRAAVNAPAYVYEDLDDPFADEPRD
jgi:Mrp family chromosome partitioning ATPase/capsular polysaccharide biosynthesis protein